MPNQLSPTKKRVSFAESVDVLDELKRIAGEKGCTLTELIRTAILEFLDKETNSYEHKKCKDKGTEKTENLSNSKSKDSEPSQNACKRRRRKCL